MTTFNDEVWAVPAVIVSSMHHYLFMGARINYELVTASSLCPQFYSDLVNTRFWRLLMSALEKFDLVFFNKRLGLNLSLLLDFFMSRVNQFGIFHIVSFSF